MKILIINPHYYPNMIGGCEHSVKKLAENLSDKHDISILCLGKENKTETINNVFIDRVRLRNIYYVTDNENQHILKKMLFKLLDIYNPFNNKKLKNEIKKINPDIIHTNNLYGISLSVWKIAYKLHIPVVHTIRDYYLMCPTVNLRKTNNTACTSPRFICKFYRVLKRHYTKYVSFVTAPSEYTLNLLLKNNYFKKCQSKVVYNAIDFSFQEFNEIKKKKECLLLERDCINFVFLGTLHESKGLKWLIDSFKKINIANINLYIAGKGNLNDYVITESNRDKRIIYKGFLSENEVSELLIESDVLICPSLVEEPFGRVVIDAYKHCVPVIASNKGGLSEIVDNTTGIVINTDNVESLVNAINYFCDDTDNILKRFNDVEQKLIIFDINNQVKKFNKIYIDLL